MTAALDLTDVVIDVAAITHTKKCGACGERGHMRQICPKVPYKGETLEQRRARQEARQRECSKQRWMKNKEQYKEASKRSYQRHAKKRIASVAAYQAANPDKRKEWFIRYQDENRERLKAERKAERERRCIENPKATWLKETFKAAQARARKRGLPFDKRIPSLELPSTCPVLGIVLVYGGLMGKSSPNSPSLDRIWPELGYVVSNLRVISNRANTLKNDATLDELRAVVRDMEKFS